MEKYSIRSLKITVIILSILSFLLLTAIAIGARWLLKRSPEYRAPQEGIWCCESLGLKLSFDQGEVTVYYNGDTTMICALVSNKYSPNLTVSEIEDRIPIDDGTTYGYLLGDILFSFKIKYFSNDSMVVGDDAGNVYVFQREQ